jgi:hypothetical protein
MELRERVASATADGGNLLRLASQGAVQGLRELHGGLLGVNRWMAVRP